MDEYMKKRTIQHYERMIEFAEERIKNFNDPAWIKQETDRNKMSIEAYKDKLAILLRSK